MAIQIPEWTVSHRMAMAREAAHFDQEAMAKKMGVSRAAISVWERGGQPRHFMKVLEQWAELCNVPLDWLLLGNTPAGTSSGQRSSRKRWTVTSADRPPLPTRRAS